MGNAAKNFKFGVLPRMFRIKNTIRTRNCLGTEGKGYMPKDEWLFYLEQDDRDRAAVTRRWEEDQPLLINRLRIR
jgi:hypothetical protein